MKGREQGEKRTAEEEGKLNLGSAGPFLTLSHENAFALPAYRIWSQEYGLIAITHKEKQHNT